MFMPLTAIHGKSGMFAVLIPASCFSASSWSRCEPPRTPLSRAARHGVEPVGARSRCGRARLLPTLRDTDPVEWRDNRVVQRRQAGAGRPFIESLTYV